MSIDHEYDPGDPDGDVSEGTRTALGEIEGLPLEERAPGYEGLAARLRDELEQSDPSNGTRPS